MRCGRRSSRNASSLRGPRAVRASSKRPGAKGSSGTFDRMSLQAVSKNVGSSCASRLGGRASG